MENESFEDAEVAAVLNKYFVAIKVDKEERPDIDSVYMTICQAITGQGGWPLTIIMTPQQKPFFAGTYFPKNSRYNMPGLMDILGTVIQKWGNEKDKLIQSGNNITNILKSNAEKKIQKGKLSKDSIEAAKQHFEQAFDEKYGGFSPSPKFPSPHNLMFLLRYAKVNDDKFCISMVEKTLQQMYKGGIFDHIGYGFSRYSTDDKWLVPHFEKMLYDNALLTIAYLETYQLTNEDFYKNVAEKILKYILSEMTSPEGGFYCAQDADSEGIEGKYYVFSAEEIIEVLGQEDGQFFNEFYDITTKGNFEGKNIPNLIKNSSFNQKNQKADELCAKLYKYRLTRTALHKDDKILTSWNALMTAAFAKAYKITSDDKYYTAAENAINFISTKLSDKDNQLFVRYRDGHTAGTGTLDDYAFLVWALLELYDAAYDERYLNLALKYNSRMLSQFWDEDGGGFYLSAKEGENLIFRLKETYDGAMPSGNSVAAYNLLRLAKLTGTADLEETAYKQLEFLTAHLQDYPAGCSFSLISMIFALYPAKEIVCVVNNAEDIKTLQQAINKQFLPNTVVLVKNMENNQALSKTAPFTNDYTLKNNQMTFYICENKACSAPITSIEEFKQRLN